MRSKALIPAKIPLGLGSVVFLFLGVPVNPGDSVTWTNSGGGIDPHNVVADDASFRCANGCDGDGMGGDGTPSPVAP